MEVRHLRLLRELADRGSVTAVAAATHRTVSAVSQQLRTAQRDFDEILVEPAGRGVRLTDAGRLLADGAIEVATAVAGVQGRWDEFRHGPGGAVSVAALPSAAEFLLPRLLTLLANTGVRALYRDVDLPEADFPAMTRDYDIVICHHLASHPTQHWHGLRMDLLAREPLDIALPPTHPLAGKPTLSPHDVVDEPWIGVPQGYPFDTVRTGIEAATGRATRVVQRIMDNRVVEALVAAGHGIAVLPRFTTSPGDRIALRPLLDVPAVRNVIALSRPDRAQRGAVRHTLDALHTIGEQTATAITPRPND